MSEKLLAVDGNSIINRAFYGVRPLFTKDGFQTNAIYGLITIVQKYIQELNPEYVVICFDVHKQTFRHEMYSEYKAGRHETPQELINQFEPSKECMRAFGYSCVERPGFEADDLLGTYSKLANDEGIEAFVLTGDRDSLQLISDHTTVYLARNGYDDKFNRAKFNETYGIQPEQFVDVKSLMGDQSDNIPGVPGVGEKTALKFISEYGTLDNLYEAVENDESSKAFTAKTKEKLLVNKDSAYMSKTLATIICNVTEIPSLEEVKVKETDKEKLKKLFTEFQFNSFIKQYGLENVGTDEKKSSDDDFSFVSDGKTEDLKEKDYAVIVDYNGDSVYYGYKNGVIKVKGIANQKSILDSTENDFCVFDVKEHYHEMKKYGIELLSVKDDVKLMAYVCNSLTNVTTLDKLVKKEFGSEPDKFEENAKLLYEMRESFKKELEETGVYNLYKNLEFPLARVLFEMEDTGFKVDISQLDRLSESLGETQRELEERIYMQAGGEFNINSPKQLGKVLYEDLRLPQGKKNKTGYSTDAETLEELKGLNPIIEDILDYRTIAKLKATYAEGLREQADENDRIHTCFKQALTATGRLSSADPNLQNIPVKTELGREFRKCFIAKNEDYVLIDADYSQIELRVLAAISGDENMTETFIEGKDIHTRTAMNLFGVSEDNVTIETRKKAKVINFGILYGMSDYTLANDLHTSRRVAAEYIDGYLRSYPQINEYFDKTIKFAYDKKYVVTMFGRRRYIPEIASTKKNDKNFGERVAKNSPIQGTAADIMKMAMINTDKKLKEAGLDARLVLQVHDELIVESSKKDAEKAYEILKTEMENATSLNVPLTVEINTGSNWLEAH